MSRWQMPNNYRRGEYGFRDELSCVINISVRYLACSLMPEQVIEFRDKDVGVMST